MMPPPPPPARSETPSNKPQKGQQQQGDEEEYNAFRNMVLATRTVAIKQLSQTFPEATVRAYLDKMAAEGLVQRKKRGGYTLLPTPRRPKAAAAAGAEETERVQMEDENVAPEVGITEIVAAASQSPVGYGGRRSGKRVEAEFKVLQSSTASSTHSKAAFQSPPMINRKRKLSSGERAPLPPAMQRAIEEEQLECSQQSELGDLNTSQATIAVGFGTRKRRKTSVAENPIKQG